MADISINYKGSKIAELSGTGKKILNTSGKYCEGDIEVNYTPNCRSYEITLSKQYDWVLLTALDSDVLEHINDENFTVTFQSLHDYAYTDPCVPIAIATNKQQGNATVTNYPVYGIAMKQNNATSNTHTQIYYPPNKTDTDRMLSGAIFRETDGNYYFRPADLFLISGTYRLTFSW